MHHPPPIWERVLALIFLPPFMAVLIRILSYGLASVIQGRNVSKATKIRQAVEFWLSLLVMYAMGCVILLPELIHHWP